MNLRTLFPLAIAAACTVAVAVPLRAADEPRTISPELMLALEGWSDPAATLESLALEAHPEVLEAYVAAVETFHGGVPLVEHFADAWPAAAAEFAARVADGEGEDSEEAASSLEFLAFVMERGGADYAAWQTEVAAGGLAFGSFVDDAFPGVVKELHVAEKSPADQGIGLLDFLGPDADAAVFAEAEGLLGSLAGAAGTTCTCWTVASFPRYPSSWITEIDYHHQTNHPWNRFDYTVAAGGAARQIYLARQAKHDEVDFSRDKDDNRTGMQVRMQCTRDGSPTGQACSGPTCEGRLAVQVGYSSRVYEQVTASGLFGKLSRQLSADRAALAYFPPYPQPARQLFYKGVAVAGDTKDTWNPAPVASALYGSGFTVTYAGSSLDAQIQQQLLDPAATGVVGLALRRNAEGSLTRDLYAEWSSTGGAPIVLRPNQNHDFTLRAASRMYSTGYGAQNRGEGHLDSANFLVGVVDDFQCATGVQAPTPRAYWHFSRGGAAPQSKSTLQALIGSFVGTQLSVIPPAPLAPVGQYP